MTSLLEELESQALQLSLQDRQELILRLIISLDTGSEDTPTAIAQAWDKEILRRVEDMDADRTRWIPADEVMSRLRDLVLVSKNLK